MKSSTARLSILSTAVAIWACGCTGISSYSDKNEKEGPRRGMTYYLPKTEFLLSFTVARKAGPAVTKKVTADNKVTETSSSTEDTSITIACTPVFVPDHTHGAFTLHSSANELFSRTHNLTVVDGLLTSINLNDDGKIVEIVDKLGDLAVMAITGSVSGSPAPEGGDTESTDKTVAGGIDEDLKLMPLPPFPELESVPPVPADKLLPTTQEISAILHNITPGIHGMNMKDGNGTYELPGTNGRIRAVCRRDPETGGAKECPTDPWSVDEARECGQLRGIVAKNSTQTHVDVSIIADGGMLAALRADAAERNAAALKNYKDQLDDVLAQYQQLWNRNRDRLAKTRDGGVDERGKLRFPAASNGSTADLKKLEDIDDRLSVLMTVASKRLKEAGDLKEKEDAKKTAYDGKKNATGFELLRHTMTVPATIDDRVVVIPLTRSPVGVTTHELTLNNGRISNWTFTKPSAVSGLIDIPITLAKDIIGIPAAAFQTKNRDITAKDTLIKAQDTLIKDQTTLLKNRKLLQQEINPPTTKQDPTTAPDPNPPGNTDGPPGTP